MSIDKIYKISKAVNGIYAIVIIFSASMAYMALSNPPNSIVDLVNNWKEQNIYDIETVPVGEQCPLGYETVKGSDPIWRDYVLCVFRTGASIFNAVNDPECKDKTMTSSNIIHYTKCGSGNTSFCVDEAIGCPITRMTVQPYDIPPSLQTPYWAELGNNYVIWFDRGDHNTDQLPIVNIQIET